MVYYYSATTIVTLCLLLTLSETKQSTKTLLSHVAKFVFPYKQHYDYCPIGFELESNSSSICDCDPRIFPKYVSQCFISNETVLRKGNVWISYSNTTDQEGFITYLNCPYDYCIPPTTPVYINFNIPNGEDAQCAFNRTGKLCGACEEGLSLTLGTSHCQECSNNFLALLLVFFLAGIVLVAFLMIFNLTVSVGTINGLIFYANIVQANRHLFLPFEKPNFLTVFIAWVNLDFGIEACFYDGMDGYAKTWLQVVFPAYIIILAIIIYIILTLFNYNCCFRLLRLFDYLLRLLTQGHSILNILCTLFFLSHLKIIRLVIPTFLFARLEYPNTSFETMWLQDANVKYLETKHIFLFSSVCVLAGIGLFFVAVLLLWQCLIFHKILNKLNLHFNWHYVVLDTFQAPYTLEHRYWIGLLLLLLYLSYIVDIFLTSFGYPHKSLLCISFIGSVLLAFKDIPKSKIYRVWIVKAFESLFILNITIFSTATYYVIENKGNQIALAYISTGIAFFTFLAILMYHFFMFMEMGKKCRRRIKDFRPKKRPKPVVFKKRPKPVVFDLANRDTPAPRPLLANQSQRPLKLVTEDNEIQQSLMVQEEPCPKPQSAVRLTQRKIRAEIHDIN